MIASPRRPPSGEAFPEEIHIACAADDRYAAYSGAMLHSLLARHSHVQVTVHFLHGASLSGAARTCLRRLTDSFGARLNLLSIDDRRIDGLPTLSRMGLETWYRTLLPELLPALDRILYLDADILVADSLLPLWRTPLEGHPVAAVANVFEPWRSHRPAELGLPPGVRYFNAGVLLLNLGLWRQDRLGEQVLDYARAHAGGLAWADQDALNAVLAPRCLPLHPRWNCQNSFSWPAASEIFDATLLAEALHRPAIVHFEGPGFAKPWHYLNRHPHRDEFRRHLRATPFPVPPVEGRSIGNIVRRYGQPPLMAVRQALARVPFLGPVARALGRRVRHMAAFWQ